MESSTTTTMESSNIGPILMTNGWCRWQHCPGTVAAEQRDEAARARVLDGGGAVPPLPPKLLPPRPGTVRLQDPAQRDPHPPPQPLLPAQHLPLVTTSASKSSIRRFVITEKVPTRAFSWLKAATTAFTFQTLLRHYAKWALTDLFEALVDNVQVLIFSIAAILAAHVKLSSWATVIALSNKKEIINHLSSFL